MYGGYDSFRQAVKHDAGLHAPICITTALQGAWAEHEQKKSVLRGMLHTIRDFMIYDGKPRRRRPSKKIILHRKQRE